MLKKIKLTYPIDIFLDADYSIHSGSCLLHQVKELTDVHKQYGFGETYTLGNTTIRQLWWDETQVDFKELGKQLDMEVVSVSTILQPPGNVIPLHKDTFFKIKQKYPDDNRLKVRANIYLEDWKVGHIIQYQENGDWKNSTHWKSGDGFVWSSDILHLSMNGGMKNKYSLQISGLYNK